MAAPMVPDKDPRSLHELAIDIATDIHKLATALAHAGAPPKITAALEGPAQLYTQAAKGLAAGPIGGQPSSPGPAPGGPPAPGGAPMPPGPSPAAPPSPGTPQNVAPARGPIHNSLAQAHADHLRAMQSR